MPRQVDHEERRRDIIEATWTVIASEGYEAASMRRIATEVGSTTGRVTHYFDSKDDILLEVLTRAHTSGLDRLSADLDNAGADLGAIREAIVDSLPLDEDRQREWRAWLAFWGRATTSVELAEQHRRSYRQWRGRLARSLALATEVRLDSAKTDVAAEHLLAVIDGLGMHLLLEPDRLDRDALDRIITNHLERFATLSDARASVAKNGPRREDENS